MTSALEEVTLESVTIVELDEPITVYNFEVEGFHTYFVSHDGVLVHNTCGMNKLRVLKEVNIKGYCVSMDLERGGSGAINIHVKVDSVKYFYDGNQFLNSSGQRLPSSLRDSALIQNALNKPLTQ